MCVSCDQCRRMRVIGLRIVIRNFDQTKVLCNYEYNAKYSDCVCIMCTCGSIRHTAARNGYFLKVSRLLNKFAEKQ